MELLITLLLAAIFILMIAAMLAIWLWPLSRWERILDIVVTPLKSLKTKPIPEVVSVPVEVESEQKSA